MNKCVYSPAPVLKHYNAIYIIKLNTFFIIKKKPNLNTIFHNHVMHTFLVTLNE